MWRLRPFWIKLRSKTLTIALKTVWQAAWRSSRCAQRRAAMPPSRRNSRRPRNAGEIARHERFVTQHVAFGSIGGGRAETRADTEEEVSHSAESIHEEPLFKASRKRVHEALIDTNQFDKVIQLSGVMNSGTSLGTKPTEIGREAGAAFAIFGGYITGRQIELVPNERIVQAWRVGSWNPGVYSIAKFDLVEQGSGTKIVFHHTGFPKADGQHLADGWKAHYWEPLEKLLA